MSEINKVEDTVQDIPKYEKLTDADKIVLAVAIKNILSRYSLQVTMSDK